MSELKACPICGSEAFKTVETVEGYDDFADYDIATVECHNPNCRLQMQDADSPRSDEINKRWNTRPLEDALTARIADLEGALKKIIALENEWDAPNDFSNDLKKIAQEVLKGEAKK